MIDKNFLLNAIVGTCVLAVLSMAIPGHAGLKTTDKNISKKWQGRWYADSKAVLTIHSNDTFYQITGTDKYSNFQVHCLPDGKRNSNILICVGFGRQLNGNPFTYNSRIQLENSDSLIEEWTANAWDETEDKVKKVTGRESFSRKNDAVTR